jgi:GrpB-like predicted nucleotidyltransferase (UPF0157 family)
VNAAGPIVIETADPRWPQEFRTIASRLRTALGPTALRIDHVGSTAVPGLDAKPVIDIQVSVARLDPDELFRRPLESLGYVLHADNPDRTKRFFGPPPGTRPVHIHVRCAGSFDEQLNLLLRDYLRTHAEAGREYAQRKWELAERFRTDREGYVRAKEPTIWSILVRAHDWAQSSGWAPGSSDA